MAEIGETGFRLIVVRRINSGLSVMRFFGILTSLTLFVVLLISFWRRAYVEKLWSSQSTPKAWKYRWIIAAVGALLLFAFPFTAAPCLGLHASLGQHVFFSVISSVAFVAFMASSFFVIQRAQGWQYAARIRFAFAMLIVAGLCALASLYFAFS